MSPSRISRCSFGWKGQQPLASCSNYGTWRSGGGAKSTTHYVDIGDMHIEEVSASPHFFAGPRLY